MLASNKNSINIKVLLRTKEDRCHGERHNNCRCSMASVVCVWPMHLLAGIAADLNEDLENPRGFDVIYSASDEDGNPGYKLTLLFEIPTQRSPTGRVNIDVSGGRFLGGAEAERSAVVAMLERLRTQYQIFPVDFNFICISQNRNLYSSMKARLSHIRIAYSELDESLKECKSGIDKLCNDVSLWIGSTHPDTQIEAITAGTAFHMCMLECSNDMAKDGAHASLLVDMMMAHDSEPKEQRFFDQTVPTNVGIDWKEITFCSV